MAVYINGIGTISPQHTFGDVPFLDTLKEHSNNKLTCIEPDYAAWIDPKAIRRMSKIIRMGVAAAGQALKEAGLQKPDAIITGTALGCLEDTGIFLSRMIENKEEAVNPTPFIQSTHNTIGSQIALLLQCYGYNQTYTHRAFSFENSLLDAMLMIEEEQNNILVGGVDEVTTTSFDILNRFNLHKDPPVSNLDLFTHKSKGSITGEGAVYFLVSGDKKVNTYACIKNMATFYKPESTEEIHIRILGFLSAQSLQPEDVDFILLGKNGDVTLDEGYDQLADTLFPAASVGVYKHLCGEYETANAFALWIAAKIIHQKKIPDTVLHRKGHDKIVNRILLYNQYLGSHHSLILVESC